MIDAQEFIVYATFLVVMIIWIEIKGMDSRAQKRTGAVSWTPKAETWST